MTPRTPKRPGEPVAVVDRLLRFGYFPKELPPTFRTAGFADFVSDSGLKLEGAPERSYLVSKPGVHNLGRPGQLRRKLQIWNPFSYYELCQVLADGWADIRAHLEKSKISLSLPHRDDSDRRAYVTARTGNELPEERARVRASARYLLRTDVARFYHSIYTHSIPWALHGKSRAKKQRKDGLGNEIDRALRNGQDGQTLGIPIGPDTSLIIAEIVATCVDRGLEDLGVGAFRFIDDYEIGFSHRSAAEEGLARVEERLAEFELAINPLKTSIDDLPLELVEPWKAEIRRYEFQTYEELGKKDILNYFNRVFALHREFPTESIIAYGVGRLRAIDVDADDWDLLLRLLLQCAVAEPASLPTVLGQISRHAEHGMSAGAKGLLKKVLEEIIVAHAPLAHGSEVGWALWTAIWFRLSLSKQVGKSLATIDDPVVALLALHAREDISLDLGPTEKAWKKKLTRAELYDRNWLLAYEAVRRGWLSSREEKAIRDDPNFQQLFASDVAFYNEAPEAPVSYLYDVTGYGDFILADHNGDF